MYAKAIYFRISYKSRGGGREIICQHTFAPFPQRRLVLFWWLGQGMLEMGRPIMVQQNKVCLYFKVVLSLLISLENSSVKLRKPPSKVFFLV